MIVTFFLLSIFAIILAICVVMPESAWNIQTLVQSDNGVTYRLDNPYGDYIYLKPVYAVEETAYQGYADILLPTLGYNYNGFRVSIKGLGGQWVAHFNPTPIQPTRFRLGETVSTDDTCSLLASNPYCHVMLEFQDMGSHFEWIVISVAGGTVGFGTYTPP